MDSFHNLGISGNRRERPSSSRRGAGLSKELFKAAFSGDLKELKRLLKMLEVKDGLAETIANLKHDHDGESLLHAAASGEDAINVCKYLVEKVKLDVNIESAKSGQTPLNIAIHSGHYHNVLYLLQNGANPNVVSKEGNTPLQCAVATSRDSKITKLLLSKGADPNKTTSRGTALLVAATRGKNDCVEALLKNRANPNVIPFDIVSPLLASVEAGYTECVKLLLELTGAKPVEAAALHHNHEALMILLPRTTPIPNISDWSSDGIMEHVFSEEGQAERKCRAKVDVSFLKSKVEECMKAKDIIGAVSPIAQVLAAYPTDAETLLNRSSCFAQLGGGDTALEDALSCIRIRPDWPKAHHGAGVAFMILKKFEEAADAFYNGWKLDLEDKELEYAFWDAMAALSDASWVGPGQPYVQIC